MSPSRSYARANVAVPDELRLQGGAVGYKPAAPQGLFYFPSKGAHFANRRIARRTHTVPHALRTARAWVADPANADSPAVPVMRDYLTALEDFVLPRGEMHIYLRCNN